MELLHVLNDDLLEILNELAIEHGLQIPPDPRRQLS